MDYNLGALKLMCGQLKDAQHDSSSPSAMTLNGILFQRAWLQGILVSGSKEDNFLLDDGTALVELFLPKDKRNGDWDLGMYVMVVGKYVAGASPTIMVHKMVDLSSLPDREALWYLEVIEAYKLFYESAALEE